MYNNFIYGVYIWDIGSLCSNSTYIYLFIWAISNLMALKWHFMIHLMWLYVCCVYLWIFFVAHSLLSVCQQIACSFQFNALCNIPTKNPLSVSCTILNTNIHFSLRFNLFVDDNNTETKTRRNISESDSSSLMNSNIRK